MVAWGLISPVATTVAIVAAIANATAACIAANATAAVATTVVVVAATTAAIVVAATAAIATTIAATIVSTALLATVASILGESLQLLGELASADCLVEYLNCPWIAAMLTALDWRDF